LARKEGALSSPEPPVFAGSSATPQTGGRQMPRKPRLRNPKGSGAVPFQRSDGRWTAFVTTGYRDGKQQKKWIYGASEREVVQKLRAVQGQASSAVLPHRENITCGVWLNRFADARGREVKQGTREGYKYYIGRWQPHIGETRLKSLNDTMIRAAMVRFSEQMGDSYRKQLYDFINAALTEAVKQGLIDANPAAKVDRPRIKDKKVQDAWTEEQAQAFLGAVAGHALEPLFYMCLVAGLRIGEALALRWQDIGSKSLHVKHTLNRSKVGERFIPPKWDSSGVVPLHAETLTMLERHRLTLEKRRALAQEAGLWQELNLVFPSQVGTPLEYRNVLRVFDKAVQQAGIPRCGGTHVFRRTFVTLAFAFLEPREVQAIVRHKSSTITMEDYARVRQSRQDRLGLSLPEMLTPDHTLKDTKA
jgi:integrase